MRAVVSFSSSVMRRIPRKPSISMRRSGTSDRPSGV